MSELLTDNIQSASGGRPSFTAQYLLAQRTDYDQVAPAVDDSLNTTSVTDTSAGLHTVNYTNNFADRFYAVGTSSLQTGGAVVSQTNFDFGTVSTQKTTSACAYESTTNNGAETDTSINCHQTIGDLA